MVFKVFYIFLFLIVENSLQKYIKNVEKCVDYIIKKLLNNEKYYIVLLFLGIFITLSSFVWMAVKYIACIALISITAYKNLIAIFE